MRRRRTCPSCQSRWSTGARWCGTCGAPLAPGGPGPAGASEPRRSGRSLHRRAGVAAALLGALGLVVLVDQLRPEPADDEVVLGDEITDGEFTDIDQQIDCGRAEGCVRWAQDFDGAWRGSELLRVDDVVVTLTGARLRGWSLADGEPRWEREMGSDEEHVPSLLRVGGGLLGVREAQWLRLVSATDGELVAELEVPGLPHAAVLADDHLRVAWIRRPGAGDAGGAARAVEGEAEADAADTDPDAADTDPDAGVGAYDLAEEQWRWQRGVRTTELAPAVLVADGQTVRVLEPESGRVRWTWEGEHRFAVFVGDAVVVQHEDEVLVRRLTDGERVARVPGNWRAIGNPDPTASPIPQQEPIVVATEEGRHRALGADGTVWWERDALPRAPSDQEADGGSIRLTRAGQDLVYVHGTGDDEGEPLLDVTTGEVVGRVPVELTMARAPMSLYAPTPGTLVGDVPGSVVALDLERGRQLWRMSRAGGPRGSTIAPDVGVAVILGLDQLVALEWSRPSAP